MPVALRALKRKVPAIRCQQQIGTPAFQSGVAFNITAPESVLETPCSIPVQRYHLSKERAGLAQGGLPTINFLVIEGSLYRIFAIDSHAKTWQPVGPCTQPL